MTVTRYPYPAEFSTMPPLFVANRTHSARCSKVRAVRESPNFSGLGSARWARSSTASGANPRIFAVIGVIGHIRVAAGPTSGKTEPSVLSIEGFSTTCWRSRDRQPALHGVDEVNRISYRNRSVESAAVIPDARFDPSYCGRRFALLVPRLT